MNVLLVDDHELVRVAIGDFIARDLSDGARKVEMHHANSILSAATICETSAMDLVLLDLGLPPHSGVATLIEFRKMREEVPVVVLSGTDDAETVRHALNEGAMGYVPKTLSRELLIAAIRVVLAGGIYIPTTVLNGSSPAPRKSDSNALLDQVGLTDRQRIVFTQMLKNLSYKQIGRNLNIEEQTVKTHASAVLKAFDVHKKGDLIVKLHEIGFKPNVTDV